MRDPFIRLAGEVGRGVRTYSEVYDLIAAFWRQVLDGDDETKLGENCVAGWKRLLPPRQTAAPL